MTRALAGRQVNPIGLGCMGLSHGYGTAPAPEEAGRLLNRALDLGYDHFDTANIYGGGRNEQLIGAAIGHRRDEFFLASKTGIMLDGPKRGTDCHPDSIAASLDASLKRLGTDHLDLFYMHRFDRTVPIADSVGAMARAIEAGKIRAYGVSEWSSAHIAEAHAVHPMAAVQTEYSLWTRNVELGVLATTARLGIALVAFSPVGRGALAGGVRDTSVLLPGDIRFGMPRFQADNWSHNLALVDSFADLAEAAGITPAQLCLAWVLAQGSHIHAIPGTTSLDHLATNAGASGLTVAPELLAPELLGPELLAPELLAPELLAKAGALINQHTVAGPRYAEAMQGTIDTEEFA